MSTFEGPTNNMESQVKIPEGVEVEQPKRNEKNRRGLYIPGIPDVPRDPGLPKIIYPHYVLSLIHI